MSIYFRFSRWTVQVHAHSFTSRRCEANLACRIANLIGLKKFILAWDLSCLPISCKVISLLIQLCCKYLVWWMAVGVRLRPYCLFREIEQILYLLTVPNQTLIIQSQQCPLSLLCPIFKHLDAQGKKKVKRSPPPFLLSLLLFLGNFHDGSRIGIRRRGLTLGSTSTSGS